MRKSTQQSNEMQDKMKAEMLAKKQGKAKAHAFQMMHMLTEGIDEPVYISDPETYRILFANDKTKEEFGFNIIGKNCYRIFKRRSKPCRDCTNRHVFGKNLGKTYVWDHQNNWNRHWYRGICKAIEWTNGKYVRYGIAIDITKQKKTEEALQDSEQFFRSVVENSHDAILVIGGNFKTIYVNDEALHMSGYSREEVIGQDFRRFVFGSDRACLTKRYIRRQKGCRAIPQYEFRIVAKDGSLKDVEVKSVAITNADGKVCTISQLRDITEYKKIELERKRFEERLSRLNVCGQSLNLATSMEEAYELVLEATLKTLGFEIADVLVVCGKNLQLVAHQGYSKSLVLQLPLDGDKGLTVKAARKGKSIYAPDVRKDKIYTAIFSVKQKGKTTKLRKTRRRGILSELAVPIKVGNEVLGVLNVESKRIAAFDEQDMKLLEILASHAAIAMSNLRKQDQLKELTRKLSCLMENTTLVMNIKDMRDKLKAITRAIREFGWKRVVISLRDENLEGKDLVTLGLTREENKLLRRRKASGHVWKERFGPSFERYRLNEFYYLPWSDPWIRQNVHGLPPEASPEEATTYAGVPSKLSVEEMIDWHPQDMLYAPLRTQEGRIVGILSMDDPCDGRRPTEGSLAPLDLFLHQAAMVIENAQLITNLRDARNQLQAYTLHLEQMVEERTHQLRESQERFLKVQRLAVIGELAGMVGHDLRNPLASIGGATYYLKKHLETKTPPRIMEMLDLIEDDISYSNKIINDLLDYSREITLDLTETNPRALVKNVLSCLQIPKNVRLIDISEKQPRMRTDAGKIRRVFLNIIKNAIDAMPYGGKLKIQSRTDGENVEFIFSDTGTGISKEAMDRLWTPLFTTKAKGMGFGLPICKRFVEAHGGCISVRSVLKKGTTFTVTLPIDPKTEDGGDRIWIKMPESLSLTTTKT